MWEKQRSVALITGASSGIGAAFARTLAAQQHDLILVARREDRLRELAKEVQDVYGIKAEVHPADLSRETDIQRIEALAQQNPNIVMLVNNAGFGTAGRFVEVDVEKSAAMVMVHVTATVRLTRAFLPQMIARNQGTIINLSTIVSDIAQAGTTVYCATKSFVNSFSRSLQLEMDEKGLQIKVRAVLPGLTDTEFFSTDEYQRRGIAEEFTRYIRPCAEVVEATLNSLTTNDVIVLPDPVNRLVYTLMVEQGKSWPEAVRIAYEEIYAIHESG